MNADIFPYKDIPLPSSYHLIHTYNNSMKALLQVSVPHIEHNGMSQKCGPIPHMQDGNGELEVLHENNIEEEQQNVRVALYSPGLTSVTSSWGNAG
jgi:hypothetical protein